MVFCHLKSGSEIFSSLWPDCSQWSHLQSAWPRCMSCQKKKDAKNFSPLVHLLKYCPNLWALNLAILPPLPVCRHFSHFKRERRKLCWWYFPTGPIIVTFSMIENRHRWCMWSDIALSNYMIKWQTIYKTGFFLREIILEKTFYISEIDQNWGYSQAGLKIVFFPGKN